MQKVLIGTPSYDGRIDVWFANSLVATVKEAEKKGIHVHAIYTSYDSLVQRARNDLVRLALDGGYDTLFFIDSDVEWEPEWFFSLLERPEPIVGGALVKKFDGEFPDRYFNEIMDYLDIDPEYFKNELTDRFRSPHLWGKDENDNWIFKYKAVPAQAATSATYSFRHALVIAADSILNVELKGE